MTKLLLTDAIVRALPAPDKGPFKIYRAAQGPRGLGLRVMKSGAKSWVLDYSIANVRHEGWTIGNFPAWTTKRAHA